MSEENPKEREIRIVAKDRTLCYQEILTWRAGHFEELMKKKSRVRSREIERFKETYDVEADNFRVGFNKESNSTILRCNVHGEMYAESSYNLLWFLNPHDLDLIYDFAYWPILYHKITDFFQNHCTI